MGHDSENRLAIAQMACAVIEVECRIQFSCKNFYQWALADLFIAELIHTVRDHTNVYIKIIQAKILGSL